MALIAAGVIAAGAVAAAGIAASSGTGDNSFHATNVKDTDKYDAYRFEYGRSPDGAEMTSRRYGLAADRLGRRQAHQSPTTNINYAQANDWQSQALAARAEQGQIANLMHRRAAGELPSIAGMQARQDMGLIQQGAQSQMGLIHQNAQNQMGLLQQNADSTMRQSMAQQAAQQASARGAAGVALAQQQAANNNANTAQQVGYGAAQASGNIGMYAAQQSGNVGMASQQAMQNVSNQAQINAWNERMVAEQNAFGAYSGMRGADMGSQAQAAQQAQQQATLFQANNQFNAGHRAAQATQNDQAAMALYGMEESIRSQQLQADIAQQQIMASQHMGAQGLIAGANTQNATNQSNLFNGAVGSVEGAANWYAQQQAQSGGSYGGGGGSYGSQPPLQNTRADGGPVSAGQQYLVGERGPEMVVPRRPQYRAEGGPISSGQPYIVGERGPELLVPQTDGLVIPNHVIDAGEIDEPESYRQPIDFRRDSRADQRRVADNYYKGLLKEADAYKAGMRASLGRGASVALDGGEIDAPPPAQLMGGRDDPYGQRKAMDLAEAFPTQARPQMMAASEAFPSDAGVLSDDRAKLAIVETDAYLRGLKQGGRETKAGLVDWENEDTTAYRKALLSAKNKPEKPAAPMPKPEKDYHRMTNGERAVFEKAHGMDWPRDAEEQKAWEERRGIEEWERSMAGQPGRLPPSQREKHFRDSLASTDKTDMTDQLATGLAPISFEYKPGLGPPGKRTGVRAQGMETQPVTAPAVTTGPDGLRRIDPDQGLSTALAGVGHLAQRVRHLEGRAGR